MKKSTSLLALLSLFIILYSCGRGPSQDADMLLSRQYAIANNDKLWKDGENLRVSIIDGSKEQIALFKEALGQWEKYMSLTFKVQFLDVSQVSSSNTDVSVSFTKRLENENMMESKECNSFIGTDSRGQKISMSLACPSFSASGPKGTYLHEIGHALGLRHEHQHQNRDLLRQDLHNICQAFNFSDLKCEKMVMQEFKCLDTNSTCLTEYDRSSIMHYQTYFTGREGELIGSTPNYQLSLKDRVSIFKLYPTSKITLEDIQFRFLVEQEPLQQEVFGSCFVSLQRGSVPPDYSKGPNPDLYHYFSHNGTVHVSSSSDRFALATKALGNPLCQKAISPTRTVGKSCLLATTIAEKSTYKGAHYCPTGYGLWKAFGAELINCYASRDQAFEQGEENEECQLEIPEEMGVCKITNINRPADQCFQRFAIIHQNKGTQMHPQCFDSLEAAKSHLVTFEDCRPDQQLPRSIGSCILASSINELPPLGHGSYCPSGYALWKDFGLKLHRCHTTRREAFAQASVDSVCEGEPSLQKGRCEIRRQELKDHHCFKKRMILDTETGIPLHDKCFEHEESAVAALHGLKQCEKLSELGEHYSYQNCVISYNRDIPRTKTYCEISAGIFRKDTLESIDHKCYVNLDDAITKMLEAEKCK